MFSPLIFFQKCYYDGLNAVFLVFILIGTFTTSKICGSVFFSHLLSCFQILILFHYLSFLCGIPITHVRPFYCIFHISYSFCIFYSCVFSLHIFFRSTFWFTTSFSICALHADKIIHLDLFLSSRISFDSFLNDCHFFSKTFSPVFLFPSAY